MKHINLTGFWCAILSLILALCYCMAQLLSWLNMLRHPHELFWVFLPSLFLAPAYLMTMLCLHYAAPAERRLWTAMGAAFGIIYCAFATLNYFSQLTVVVPALLQGSIDESYVLIFKQGSFPFAMDCLGYFFMSLSSLTAALAFRGTDNGLFRWLFWNGLLIVIFIAAYFNPFFYFVGSPWMVTFSLAMIYAARRFRQLAALS